MPKLHQKLLPEVIVIHYLQAVWNAENAEYVYAKKHNLVFNWKKSAANTFVKNRFATRNLHLEAMLCHAMKRLLIWELDRCFRDAPDVQIK